MAWHEDLCVSERQVNETVRSTRLAIEAMACAIHSNATTPQTAKLNCLLPRERTLTWYWRRLDASMVLPAGDALPVAVGLLCWQARNFRCILLHGDRAEQQRDDMHT
jgi:hypothetical protein